MASNGALSREGDTQTSLEKIKRQLASSSGRNLLQGPLLKRSETLRKWNERWVILDPTTGKMEYKIRRNEPTVKGTIVFDANSTITLSPVNFHGLPKYDGCCFYVGTPQKKDYFLCAETPGAARAWVSTLHATQLVLKAHKEAVNSLSGNGSARLGTVATVVAAANSTSQEASKEIEAAMQIAMRNALGSMMNRPIDGPMDDFTIMKVHKDSFCDDTCHGMAGHLESGYLLPYETLLVKDEELQHLARDLRARDSTIKEIAEKLSETAEAAEAAASAAHTMDEQRRLACAEIERLAKNSEKQSASSMLKLKEFEEKAMVLSKEKDQLIKQRDSALQEAHLWRSELAKARERVVILEGAVVRAEEKVRVTEAEAEARLKEAAQNEAAALKEKQELLAYVNMLQAQLQRQQVDTKQVFEEKTESCSDNGNAPPRTKHVDPSEENVDKACLSVSRAIPVSGESVVCLAVDQPNLGRPIGDGEWSDIQATEATIADVREISPEAEGRSLDIPVLRKWNERWVILDLTTGKMEYKIRRNEPTVKGTIVFDANSTITLSPVNFHGLPKYDGCCFYVGTPQKKDYFLCAETPGAARAWVSTLHATQLVLKAHKEAVNSISGNGSAKLGTVATVVAAANSTSQEASKEIEAAMQIAMRNALGSMMNRPIDGPMDDFTIMKAPSSRLGAHETLRVKDEELQHLARDLRARDSTIKEIAEKLSETAEAAEAAASAAHTMDEQRRLACAEIERLAKDSENKFASSKLKLKESEEKAVVLSKEKDQLIKQRDSAIQEAHLWRSELAKARERVVILEGAVVRAEEKVRIAEADAEARIKEAVQNEAAALKEKQELLAYVNMLKAQLQRQQVDTKQVFEEKTESCSDNSNAPPRTKHVDPSEENVDKACLSVSRAIPVSGESVVCLAVDQPNLGRPIGDGEWSDIQATEATIADVRNFTRCRREKLGYTCC
ncbi:hypothetical protein RHGRI_033125 [Rhododendron griersonianum]|uniref:PH domain-containing protein n=1 Tax=Rhododendron griersonianum TaxID=479676 RepID=A0AAV6HW00_9ERIC|nr:hypothetical protein RHGRI_033125 [Rhododendron griersonianum]